MDSDFVVGINKSIDAAKGETHEYPSYTHNTLVTEKLDELTEAIKEGGGGASSLADLEDVDISGTVPGGKVLKYNAVEEKWAPGDDSGNVQSDWNEDDPTSGAFILNKPTIPPDQVQADWNESDSSDPSYIQNKPTIPSSLNDLSDVDLASLQNGQIIQYDGAQLKWVAGVLYIEITQANYDQLSYAQKHNGIPYYITDGQGSKAALSALKDVDFNNLQDGQTIQWDAANSKWINVTPTGGSSITVIPGTLVAGTTSVTFTDARILADSIVSCATPAGINPTAMTSSVGEITFYFASQASDITVKAVIF